MVAAGEQANRAGVSVGVLIVGRGKTTPNTGDALIGSARLYDQKGLDCGQKRQNIHHSAKAPGPLNFYALDGAAAQAGVVPLTNKAAKLREKVDNLSVGAGKCNLPWPISRNRSVAANPTFAVNYAGHVSESRLAIGNRESRSATANKTKCVSCQTAIVIPISVLPNSQDFRFCRNFRSEFQALEGRQQFTIGRSRGPSHAASLIVNCDAILAAALTSAATNSNAALFFDGDADHEPGRPNFRKRCVCFYSYAEPRAADASASSRYRRRAAYC
jgi:hypothetical protein